MSEPGNISFREMYEMHKHRVFNTALSYLKNQEDAEDITQEVFLEVYHSIDFFRQQSKLATWIYRITVNKCIDFTRKKKSKKRWAIFTEIFHKDSGEEKAEISKFEHPNVDFDNKEEIKLLYNALDSLPDKSRIVMVLFYFEGQSQKDIAAIFDTSPKAIESLIARTRKTLKEEIEKKYKF